MHQTGTKDSFKQITKSYKELIDRLKSSVGNICYGHFDCLLGSMIMTRCVCVLYDVEYAFSVYLALLFANSLSRTRFAGVIFQGIF